MNNVDPIMDAIVWWNYGLVPGTKQVELMARVHREEKSIQVFVTGRWRTMRPYRPNGKKPSAKTMQALADVVRLRTSWYSPKHQFVFRLVD